jgi:hypothetical protein
MAKAKFEYMSSNEWLGDPTTHFMKTGETFRAISQDQIKLGSIMPRRANGVKVEYDISFSIGEYMIKGYKFTDFLSKCVGIAPQHDMIARKIIMEVAGWGPTDYGHSIVKSLTRNITDKYITGSDSDIQQYYCKDLIVMPGTNVLQKEDMVDWIKIDELVKEGAKVKLHPVTSKVWRSMMNRRWGKSVIPGEAPLYDIMRAADRVHFTMASETGIAATLLGKKVGLVSGKRTWSNFEHIYRGIDQCKSNMKMRDKMISLFSHPESGIITTHSLDPADDIREYFEFTKKFPHGID